MIEARDRFTSAARGNRCSICGANLRPLNDADRGSGTERAVDTGIFIEFEGEFEICEHCAIEIGKAVGLVSAEDLFMANEVIEAIEIENRHLSQRLSDKEQTVHVLSLEIAEAARGLRSAYEMGYRECEDANGLNTVEIEAEEPSFA